MRKTVQQLHFEAVEPSFVILFPTPHASDFRLENRIRLIMPKDL
jgi:hypothetical protein